MSNICCSLALFCCRWVLLFDPMAQMPPLAGAFLPLLGGLVMLNAPTNLSGLLLSFILQPLFFLAKLRLSEFWMVLLRNLKTIDIEWLRFVATTAIYKVSANVDVLRKAGAFIFLSLVVMLFKTLNLTFSVMPDRTKST
jgi:hypothetical protein